MSGKRFDRKKLAKAIEQVGRTATERFAWLVEFARRDLPEGAKVDLDAERWQILAFGGRA